MSLPILPFRRAPWSERTASHVNRMGRAMNGKQMAATALCSYG